MTNPNKTLAVLIVDRSGSMSTVWDATVEGVNEFVSAQKALPGEVVFHMAVFDDQYDVVYDFVNINDVKPLAVTDYFPRGMTGLLDAVGKTVTYVGAKLAALPEDERPGKVIVAIQTDGGENSSREWTFKSVTDLLDVQKKTYSWDFVFLGAGDLASAQAQKIGIPSGKMLNYNHTKGGTKAMASAVSNYVGVARSVSSSVSLESLGFSDEDRENAKK
ncbi:VWA domain-containing protein [Myxococcus phage Mx1]|nr:VWA domain-containing protein [Myxococcus phage Mx1]